MRAYEPIWIKLKKDKKVSLTAPPKSHKRIIKAVLKEKYNDITFRFECSQLSKRARIAHSIKGSVITFMLKFTIGMDDL